MSTTRAAALAIAALMFAGAENAAAQQACTLYTVQAGDSLNSIARAAGTAGGYQVLYSANTDVVSSLGNIPAGTVLRIPCADGTLPSATAAAAAPTPTSASVAQSAADGQRPIRFLTGSNYAPFTDEGAREGGMFTELVSRAMEIGAPDTPFRVVFVNDWGSHLTELLPYGAFDMGFPWFLPDCTRLDRLSAPNRLRCTEYDASEPFFEAVVGYYSAVNSPFQAARQPSDLFGARLCRPDGWFTFDLEAEGLSAPNISLTVPATQLDCWRLLQSGEVDVVTFDALPAEEDIASLSLAGSVKEIAALATVQTLHVFSPKNRAGGQADLIKLNSGLRALRDSGEWYEIVANQMREHEARKKSGN